MKIKLLIISITCLFIVQNSTPSTAVSILRVEPSVFELQVTLLDLVSKRLKKRQVNLYALLLLRVLSLFVLAVLSLLAEVWILFQHFLHLVDLVLVVEAMLRLESGGVVDYLQGLVDGV